MTGWRKVYRGAVYAGCLWSDDDGGWWSEDRDCATSAHPTEADAERWLLGLRQIAREAA